MMTKDRLVLLIAMFFFFVLFFFFLGSDKDATRVLSLPCLMMVGIVACTMAIQIYQVILASRFLRVLEGKSLNDVLAFRDKVWGYESQYEVPRHLWSSFNSKRLARFLGSIAHSTLHEHKRFFVYNIVEGMCENYLLPVQQNIFRTEFSAKHAENRELFDEALHECLNNANQARRERREQKVRKHAYRVLGVENTETESQ